MVQPETVDEHATGERIRAAGDGQGELAAAAAFVERQAIGAGEHLEELARSDGAALIAVATDVDVAVARLLDVGDHHRGAGTSRVRDVEGVDLGEVEILGGLVVVDEGRADRDLPRLAEVAALGRALEEHDGGDILDVGQRPGEGGELGEGGIVLVTLAARLAAQLDVGEDLVVVLLEDGLVGQGDLVDRLRLEAAQPLGDERVDRGLLVGERGLEDGRGLLLEILGAELLQADKRTGDGGIGTQHATEGRIQLAALAEVIFLQDVEAGGAAETADHGRQNARGELAVVGGLHAGEMLVITDGGLVDELGELLLVVGAIGVGRGVLADQERVADDRVLLRLDDGREDAVQGIVVGGGNRVELVVVATGAGDGEAEEALGGGVDAFVDGVVGVLEALADGDEAERGEARVVLGQVRQAVGGELLDDELVVRLVGVEGVDDVIAVGPGSVEGLDGAVTLEALGVGVTRGVEPVAGPAFAVVRRSEEAVDGALDDGGDGATGLALADGHRVTGLGEVILAGEGVDLDAGGRQADQVVGKPAQQRFAVRGGTGLEALLVQLGEHEGVDLVLTPSRIAELGRHDHVAHGLEGPMAAGLVGKTGELGAAGADRRRRAHLHPLLERGDLGVGELGARLARRHRKFGIRLMHGDDQQRLLEVARDDGRALVSAGEEAGT